MEDIKKAIESIVALKMDSRSVGGKCNFMEITYKGVKIQAKLNLDKQLVEMYRVLSNDEKIKEVIDDIVKFRVKKLDNVLLKIISWTYLQMTTGLPLSCENISSVLLQKGISKENILKYNMSIRTLLYKFKYFGFTINVDNPEFDSVEHIAIVLDKTSSFRPVVEEYIKDMLEMRLKLKEPRKMETSIKMLEEVVTTLYATVVVDGTSVTEFDKIIRDYTSDFLEEFDEPIFGINNAIRYILLENKEEVKLEAEKF